MNSAKLFAVGVVLLSNAATQAAIVDIAFNVTAGSVFQYTIYNNSLPTPLTDFVVFFSEPTGPGEYKNLGASVFNQPAGWTGMAFEPSAIMLNGYVNWFTGGSGIAVGDSLGGFEVSFDNIGLSTPGSQFFEVYDTSFNKVADGWTVPEPAESALASLLAAGLWVAGTRAYRARQDRKSK
jgi:hypothetical protein